MDCLTEDPGNEHANTKNPNQFLRAVSGKAQVPLPNFVSSGVGVGVCFNRDSLDAESCLKIRVDLRGSENRCADYSSISSIFPILFRALDNSVLGFTNL